MQHGGKGGGVPGYANTVVGESQRRVPILLSPPASPDGDEAPVRHPQPWRDGQAVDVVSKTEQDRMERRG